jgi:glucan biosynthesis protein C
MSRSSLALNNLRAFVILIVLAFHSVLAYLDSSPASQVPFDTPPYRWQAIPIVDSQRWLGFDVFCAFQDVYLMTFMFFLSGLFVWPSLERKGSRKFLYDRVLRLGVPFVLGVYLLMPLAYYPSYRATAVDPSWGAFWRHWLALPMWPTGPLWFLIQLLALNVVAAGLYRFAPRCGEWLRSLSASAGDHPIRYFAGLVAASAVAYLPLAAAFTPWEWYQHGPLGLQLSRPLHYAVYFFAGVGIGAYGLERGLLAADGRLARRWAAWYAAALAGFALWVAPTALTMTAWGKELPALQLAANLGFVLSCATGCFFFAAVFLRFATNRSRLGDSLSENAYGMYLVHYVFVVWLQYLLLGLALFAIAKAAIVFGVTLLLSWAATALMYRVPLGARILGAERRLLARATVPSR